MHRVARTCTRWLTITLWYVVTLSSALISKGNTECFPKYSTNVFPPESLHRFQTRVLIWSHDKKGQNNSRVAGLELEGSAQALMVPCKRNGIVGYAFNKIFQKLVLLSDSQKLQPSQCAGCHHLFQNYTLLNGSVEFLYCHELE